MGFSEKQARALGRGVPMRNTKTRSSGGKELTYIEGWYALSQANHIFGFEGWDRETVETKCVFSRETRGNYTAVYSARVKITVRANDILVVRDGHGTGEAYGVSAGEVHDRALKAAETDATKRALATFGKAFGLALYAGAGRTKRSDEKAGNTPSPVKDLSPPATTDGNEERISPPSLPPLISPTSNGSGNAPNGAVRTGARDHAADGGANSAAGPVEADPSGSHANGAGGSRPLAHARVDKSALALAEPHRARDKEHLRFVAAQPCLLCSTLPCDAHHLRFAQPRAMGRKVGDDHTVPLCRKHHSDLHESGNEAAWWHDMGIDAIEIAKDLWKKSVTTRLASAENRA